MKIKVAKEFWLHPMPLHEYERVIEVLRDLSVDYRQSNWDNNTKRIRIQDQASLELDEAGLHQLFRALDGHLTKINSKVREMNLVYRNGGFVLEVKELPVIRGYQSRSYGGGEWEACAR